MQRLRNTVSIGLFICSLLLMHPAAWPAEPSIHDDFDDILQAYVVDGAVDYIGILNDPKFAQYIQALKAERTFANPDEALAYWINAYNALAIQGILDGRSPSTLLGRFGYFKRAKYQVNGREINLYDLERKVIIPLGEPRIHFAINCASQSCPKLGSRAYTAENLETQLEISTRAFINDPKRNQFDREKKIAYVSKIFDWFEQDFSEHSGSIQKYLAQYVNDPEIAQDLQSGRYKIKYLKYDWGLNGISPTVSG